MGWEEHGRGLKSAPGLLCQLQAPSRGGFSSRGAGLRPLVLGGQGGPQKDLGLPDSSSAIRQAGRQGKLLLLHFLQLHHPQCFRKKYFGFLHPLHSPTAVILQLVAFVFCFLSKNHVEHCRVAVHAGAVVLSQTECVM